MASLATPAGSYGIPRVLAQGKRVVLRTFTRGDLNHLGKWADSPFVEKMVASEFLYQYKHIYHRRNDVFLDFLLRDTTQLPALILPRDREREDAVGFVRLYGINLVHGFAFLETVIADPRSMKKGYGVEASRLLLAYALDHIGIHRVEAKVFAYNQLSINSLRRNGFRQEGVLREACFSDGRFWDILVFGILREEMEQERKKDEIVLFPPETKGQA
jgi:RimJ/RimL family protein N-acetyltransferase